MQIKGKYILFYQHDSHGASSMAHIRKGASLQDAIKSCEDLLIQMKWPVGTYFLVHTSDFYVHLKTFKRGA